jgi:hypothetical protein
MNDNEAQIWRCTEAMMQMRCPVTWDALNATDDIKVRHCGECGKNVHLCESPDQFVELAKNNECVALPLALHIASGAVTKIYMLGRPAPWNYELDRQAEEFWSLIKQAAPELNGKLAKEMERAQFRQYRLAHPDFDDTF